jgi:hypothetical protein
VPLGRNRIVSNCVEVEAAYEHGEVVGYWLKGGAFVVRKRLHRWRRAEVELDTERVTLSPHWFKQTGDTVYVNDVLEIEECCARDTKWEADQALRERAEGMLCPSLGGADAVPDVVTAYSSLRVVESNNYRAAAEGLSFGLTATDWENIVADHEGRCAYCGKRKRLVLEHVIPISRGGGTTIDNVVPACFGCNAHKRNLDPVEWMAENPTALLCFIDAAIRAEGLSGD